MHIHCNFYIYFFDRSDTEGGYSKKPRLDQGGGGGEGEEGISARGNVLMEAIELTTSGEIALFIFI